MKKKTLLFVDDEQEILKILVDLFSCDEDYSVCTAMNIADAKKIIEVGVDLVLADLNLPDGSGDDFVYSIDESVVRILTSGYLDIKFGGIRENEKTGVLYLSKPWDLVTLKRIVDEKLKD